MVRGSIAKELESLYGVANGDGIPRSMLIPCYQHQSLRGSNNGKKGTVLWSFCWFYQAESD